MIQKLGNSDLRFSINLRSFGKLRTFYNIKDAIKPKLFEQEESETERPAAKLPDGERF